jgi:hypothetical protein
MKKPSPPPPKEKPSDWFFLLLLGFFVGGANLVQKSYHTCAGSHVHRDGSSFKNEHFACEVSQK